MLVNCLQLTPLSKGTACLVIGGIVKAANAEETRGDGEKGDYHLTFYGKRQGKEILGKSWNSEGNEPLFSGLHVWMVLISPLISVV